MNDSSKKIFTIPNILSAFRICLIPVFMYLYIKQHDYKMTCAVLLISGLSDTLDGFIARHFNMISDLGKALDPIADKLTQFAMLMCLVSRFPMMLIPLLVLVVKELCCGLTSLMVIKKTGVVLPANWHGKLTTFLLYATMCLHLVWINIPASVSYVTITVCTAVMLMSFVLYIMRNVHAMRSEHGA